MDTAGVGQLGVTGEFRSQIQLKRLCYQIRCCLGVSCLRLGMLGCWLLSLASAAKAQQEELPLIAATSIGGCS